MTNSRVRIRWRERIETVILREKVGGWKVDRGREGEGSLGRRNGRRRHEKREGRRIGKKKRWSGRRRGKSLLLWLIIRGITVRTGTGTVCTYRVYLRKIHTRGERGNRGSGSRSRTVIGRAGLAVRGVSGWRRYFRSTSVQVILPVCFRNLIFHNRIIR